MTLWWDDEIAKVSREVWWGHHVQRHNSELQAFVPEPAWKEAYEKLLQIVLTMSTSKSNIAEGFLSITGQEEEEDL